MDELELLLQSKAGAPDAFGNLLRRWLRQGKVVARRNGRELEVEIDSVAELVRTDPQARADYAAALSDFGDEVSH